MKLSSSHKQWGKVLTLSMAVLVLSACNQNNQPEATNSPAASPTVSAPANNTATNTTATTAGVPPTGNDCPSNAPVKGVDTQKRGKIYHNTNYPDYKQVKPTICFADTASAEKAGYKLPQAK